MASIWTGAVSFGLVNIPVRLVSAVRSHDLSFRMLHRSADGTLCPISYERICKRDGKEAPWDEIVKGYEYEKDRFVVLTEEDFEKAALATSKTFEIQDFAPEAQVDPRFFEKPYYLVPQSGGEKAYALLREAMRNTGMLGIGTITLRKKQYLGSIKPIGEAIVLDLMRFADEVLEPVEYRFPETDDLRPQEMQMAEQLIQNLAADFTPGKYVDEYRQNLVTLIEAKVAGSTVELIEAAEPDMTGVIDLMARLEESLKATPGKGAGAPPKQAAKTPKSPPKKRRSA